MDMAGAGHLSGAEGGVQVQRKMHEHEHEHYYCLGTAATGCTAPKIQFATAWKRSVEYEGRNCP